MENARIAIVGLGNRGYSLMRMAIWCMEQGIVPAVEAGGAPQTIPDLTRGKYKNRLVRDVI